jgi:hypothetical protein
MGYERIYTDMNTYIYFYLDLIVSNVLDIDMHHISISYIPLEYSSINTVWIVPAPFSV